MKGLTQRHGGTEDGRACAPREPWPRVKLGEVCEVRAGADYKAVAAENGPYPIYGTGGEMGRAIKARCPANSVIVGRKGTLDNPMLICEPFWNIDTCFGVIPSAVVLPDYLYRFCQNFDFYSLVPAMGRPSTTSEAVRGIELPLPPLPVQREIVAQLERELGAVEKVAAKFEELEAAAEAEFKAELKETFEDLTQRHGDTEVRRVKLGDVCEVICGKTPLKTNTDYWQNGTVPWFTIDDLRQQGKEIAFTAQKITGLAASSMRIIPANTVLLCCTASIGACCISRIPLTTNQQFNALVAQSDVLKAEYLFYFCSGLTDTLLGLSSRTTIDFVSKAKVESIELPLPPLSAQRLIVGRLDAARERKERLVAAAKRGREAAALWRKAILKEAFE